MASFENIKKNQIMRISEFLSYGIHAELGGYLGAIRFSAGESEKLLKLLRKLKSRKDKKVKNENK